MTFQSGHLGFLTSVYLLSPDPKLWGNHAGYILKNYVRLSVNVTDPSRKITTKRPIRNYVVTFRVDICLSIRYMSKFGTFDLPLTTIRRMGVVYQGLGGGG